jgi:PBP1b-binding outer membrane lipoprotein LpoB
MNVTRMTFEAAGAALCAALIAGCASAGVKNPSGTGVTEMRPDEKGFVAGTGVESQDLVRVSDKIARGILGAPQIANAATPPVVVLDPVINETRFPVNKNIFLERIQARLISQASGKVMFIARERMAALERERDMKRTGQVTSSSDARVQEFKGADYFLTGKLSGLSTASRGSVSDYILYTFQLIDVRTGAIVWGGDDEIKKQGQADAVYR